MPERDGVDGRFGIGEPPPDTFGRGSTRSEMAMRHRDPNVLDGDDPFVTEVCGELRPVVVSRDGFRVRKGPKEVEDERLRDVADVEDPISPFAGTRQVGWERPTEARQMGVPRDDDDRRHGWRDRPSPDELS